MPTSAGSSKTQENSRKTSNSALLTLPKPLTVWITRNCGQPRGMVWGGRREEGSGWGTHIYLWQIHFNIWQNQCNIVKFKNKIKLKKKKAGQVLWYSHLFQNFPQFIVIHTVKGFGKVKKAEIDVFLELSCIPFILCL